MKAFGIAAVIAVLICGGTLVVENTVDFSSKTAYSTDSVRLD